MTMLDQSQQSDWLQTELESMSSQEDFPAKTSQSRDTNEELKASAVGYGQSAPVLLGSFDLDTPSLKTSQTCLMENGEIGLSEFCGTFPRSGMMRSGTVYQLPNLARTITEIGSGLLPTPAASTGGTTPNWQPFRKSGHRAQLTLQQYVRMWPTPAARDYKGARLPETMAKTGRNPETNSLPDSVEFKGDIGRLNPTWVEWLMGFPIGHTDLNA